MKYYLFICCCLAFSGLFAQGKSIYLTNTSFEGAPDDATIPVGWFACAPATTPDILPGPWGVYQEATEGETYLGLITRGDGTYESIGQRLPSPLKTDECYSFSLDLAHSNTYAGYKEPLKLRIWVGRSKCEKGQLIAETNVVDNREWETHNFEFTAEKSYRYIIIEAFHKDGRFSHQGNILIDNISSLQWCTRA